MKMKQLISRILIALLVLTPAVQAGPFIPGQVLTAAQLNSVVDSKCTNAACAITGGTVVGVTIDNSVIGGTTPANMYFTEATAMAASGTSQATATAITTQFNKITTSGTGTGVVLPTPTRAGYTVYVENTTSYFVNLYPQVGATIDTLSANAPIVLVPGGIQQVTSNSTSGWDSFDSAGGATTNVIASSSVYNGVFKNYVANAQGPQIEFYHDRGTPASSVSVTAGDGLGNIDFWGFNGASAVEGVGINAAIQNNWTTSSSDAYLVFNATQINGTTPAPAFYMYASGAVATAGINASGTFTQTYTDGTVVDYATGNGRVSVGIGDTLTMYTSGVANTQMAQFSTAGTTTNGLRIGTSGSGKLSVSPTAPTISSGFGTSPSVVANNGTAAFTINVGTGGTASSGVVAMPTATTGWSCTVSPTAAPQAAAIMYSAPTSVSSVTVTNYTLSTGAALAWPASTVISMNCVGY